MFNARAILQANGASEKVCRNLFGEVDHEQLKKDFETNLRSELELAKCKWNFDFVQECPLPGNYEWERVVDPHQEIATEVSDPTSSHESRGSSCCKRKQALITDYFQVKRRYSPLPSPC